MELRFFDDPRGLPRRRRRPPRRAAGAQHRDGRASPRGSATDARPGMPWPEGVPCWFAAVRRRGRRSSATAMRTATVRRVPGVPDADARRAAVHLLPATLLERDEPVLGRQRRAAGGPGLLRGHGRARPAGGPRVGPAHPALRARRPGRAPAGRPGGCGPPRAGRAGSGRVAGTTRSWPTPTSRPAASRGSSPHESPEPTTRCADGSRAAGSSSGRTRRRTGPRHGRDRAGVRRLADRAGLHAAGAPRPRLRQRARSHEVSKLLRDSGDARVPVHRPGQPDLEQDLRGDRLRASRRHGESARGVTAP